MNRVPHLRSERLLLRGIGPSDAEAIHPTLTDAELMTWWSGPPHESLEQTRDYLTFESRPEGIRSWAITLLPDDKALGWVTIIGKRPGVSEIGYLLDRAYWGRGIAREAIGLVLDQLFEVEGQRRVFADTDPDNTYSRGLLERLGFKLEGYLRAEWETHIGIRDTTLYGLLREEWKR